ncbi:nuclear transport factor 2 family protein [Nocardioides pacificus]
MTETTATNASAAGTPAMETPDVTTMRRLYEAFERRDLDTVRAAIHPDFVMHQTELLPWGGTHRGPDGYFAFLGTLFSYIETTVEIEDMYDSGDHVVQVGYTDGRVLATGGRFRLREVHLWQLQDGLIINWAVHLDARSMLAALG